MARKRLVTVEEAVLIHLLAYRRFSQEETVPSELSQGGIARSIGVRRSHTSSALETSKHKGLIEENLARVKGEPRRRKCYFLTGIGLKSALSLKEKVENTRVKAILKDGKEFDGKMKDLLKLAGHSFTLPGLALHTVDSVVELSEMERMDKPTGLGTEAIPLVERLVGRDREIKELAQFFKGQKRLFLLRGIPGIGKTALVAYAAKNYEHNDQIFWYNIGEWSSPRNTIQHLANYFEERGFSRLKNYLDAHEVPDMADVRDILAEVDIPAIMIFDECQNANPNMVFLLRALVSALGRSNYLRLAMVGREIPEVLDIRQRLDDKNILGLELDGLSIDVAVKILSAKGIDRKKGKEIAKKCSGHPLYLALIGSETGKVRFEDVSMLLAKEVFFSLSDNEKEILYLLSVFRKPVASNALVSSEECFAALEQMERHCLVRNADGWLMHGLLKDFFYSRQPDTEKRQRHELAAEYYKTKSCSVDNETELAYHLLKAKDEASFLRLIVAKGYNWLKQGYQDEILQLFALLQSDLKNNVQKFDAMMMKAAAMEQVGDWHESENVYSSCEEIATEQRDSVRLARCMRSLGVIYYRRGDLQIAMDQFERARNLISEKAEPGLMAHIQSSIGVVMWRLGDVRHAKEAYEKDLSISKSQKSSQGMVRALNNLGILDWQAGRYNEALERYAEALKLAERMEDKKLVAVLYSNIADAYKHKGEKKEARRFYERCLELSEELRFNWQTAEAYRGLAEVTGEKREKYLQKALHLFDKLGAKEDARLVRVMMR